MALRTATLSDINTALNHNVPIYDGTLDSQGYIKMNHLYKLYEQFAPFIQFLNNLKTITMDMPNEAYGEKIPAWLSSTPAYYKSGTVTGVAAGAPKDSFTLTFTTTSGGSTYLTDTWKPGDIIVMQNENDVSVLASFLLCSVSSNDWTCKLLTNTPGFTPTTSTKVFNKGRADAPGSEWGEPMHESVETCWVTSQEMKYPWSITLEDSVLKGLIDGSPQEVEKSDALKRFMKKVSDTLAYAGQRIGGTAGNPWSLPDKSITNNASEAKTMWTTMSFYQACQAASYFGLGTRVKKLSKTLATDTDYRDAFKEVFRYQEAGDPNLIARCSWEAYNAINDFVRFNKLNYNITPETEKYGMKIKTLEFGIGQLDLFPDKGMDGGLENAMMVINPKNIGKVQLTSLFHRDIPTSTTEIKGEWYMHCGLMVCKPYTHQMVFFQ